MTSIKKTRNIPKPTNFGSNLKFLRRLKGISQTDLAEALDMTRNKIATYEAGVVEPNAQKFLDLCSYFNVSPEEMLELNIEENPTKNVIGKEPGDNTSNVFLLQQIEEFIHHTNEMTKVLEGYKALIDLKKNTPDYSNYNSLYFSFEDLLELLEQLIKSNWEIISNIIPERMQKT